MEQLYWLEVTNRNLAAATETLQSSDGGRWEHGEAKVINTSQTLLHQGFICRH